MGQGSSRWTRWGLVVVALLLTACGPSREERLIDALTPNRVAARGAAVEQARPPLRFRIYADASWQAQKGDWQRVAEEMVEQASGMAGYAFGVSFIVERVADWPDPGPNNNLGDRLDALVAYDPGEAGVWVVGLVGGVPVASSNFDQIGLARLAGRHFVMRSMADVQEADALSDRDRQVSAGHRRLLRARLLHRRAVVFVHEWAHTMGALHVRDYAVVMASSYSQRIRSFGTLSQEIIRETLKAGDTAGDDADAELAARHETALAWYRARPEAKIDPVERAEFVDGVERAAAQSDGSMNKTQLEAAMKAGRVSAVLGAANGFTPESQAGLSDWARMTRRRFAMPVGFPAADEGDYVAAQRAVDAALTAGDMALAESRIAEIEARWPTAAAGPQLRCDVEGRQGRFDAATALCRRATELDDESVGAWLMLGMIALHTRKPAEAAPILEKVIALDALQTPAWVYLGRTYTALGRSADRAALEARFTAATGEPWPE